MVGARYLSEPIVAQIEVSFSSDCLWAMGPFLCFIVVCYYDSIVSLYWYTVVRKPPCELNNFAFYQQQNLGQRFGISTKCNIDKHPGIGSDWHVGTEHSWSPGGGGGGGVLSHSFLTRRLGPSIYHLSQKISGISSTPKNIWNFSNPKKYPPFYTLTLRKYPLNIKMHRNDP